jgi:hypothetical protein
MSNASKRPLFNSLPVLKDERPRAPSSDDRHNLVRAYDRSGAPREIVKIHLREALKLGWTLDEQEAAQRRVTPLPKLEHKNFELGNDGCLPRHSLKRSSTVVINGIAQYEVTRAATTGA